VAPRIDLTRRLAILAGVSGGLSLGSTLGWPSVVLAHGAIPPEAPTLANLALGWAFEPLIGGSLVAAALAWVLLVRRIARLHPGRPVSRARSAAFLAGLAVIAVALMSGIARYDTTLFSIHMAQHLLLMLVAAPLIALSAPVTQLLRAASPEVRRRFVLPVLQSTAFGAVGHPVVAWLTFTVVVWASHFSPLFNLALENPGVHQLEHVAFLVSGLLFWWPAVAADPVRHRLAYPARALYLLLQMPVNSFLGMAIVFASTPLYAHYATLGAPYGISPLADQQLAGGMMWLAGDVVLIAAVLAVVAAWMRHEERDAPAAERRADIQRAAITERADRLARAKVEAGEADQGIR
jgi:putative copper resistance protein D